MGLLSLVLFSGDYDRAMAALTMANGAAGEGEKVVIYFTFWGISLIRRVRAPGRNYLQSLFKWMMPVGPERLGLSRMNFLGIGPALLRLLIGMNKGQTLQDLLQMAVERGVDLVACQASLEMLGIAREELLQTKNLRIGDVHDFLRAARDSDVCLFV